MGTTEEGREQILVAISDEANLARLDRLKQVTARLGDPRGLAEAEARALVAEGKPIYWATGAMHSPETGSPEMLMELGYRLAVEETPFIQAIRRNSVVLFTPVLEVDGRERMVDLYRYRKENPSRTPPSLLYWGKYVAHDNNRDGMGLALKQSQNVMKTVARVAPARSSTTCTSRCRSSTPPPAPAPTTPGSTRSWSTSGTCSRTTRSRS